MSDALPPLDFVWTGEAMNPSSSHWARRADQVYVVGQRYALVPHEHRSKKSHDHFFAEVADAWSNLTDDLSARFVTPDHLRKWALIRVGYRDERSIVCASKAEAQRVAAFIRPMDDYAVVIVRGATVHVLTAKSQTLKAMGKAAFQDSKTKVLDCLAEMIGTTPAALAENVRRAA